MSAFVAFCKIPALHGADVEWDPTWIGEGANPFSVEQRGDVWIVTGDPTGISGRLEMRASWRNGERTCPLAPAILNANPPAVLGCYVAEIWDLFPDFANHPEWRKGRDLTVYMTDGGADRVSVRLFAAEGYMIDGEASWSVHSATGGETMTASGTLATGTVVVFSSQGVELYNDLPERNDRVMVTATRHGLAVTATVVIGRVAPSLDRYFEVWAA